MKEHLVVLLLEIRRNQIPVHTLPDFQVNCNELPKYSYDNGVPKWITVTYKIIYIPKQISSVNNKIKVTIRTLCMNRDQVKSSILQYHLPPFWNLKFVTISKIFWEKNQLFLNQLVLKGLKHKAQGKVDNHATRAQLNRWITFEIKENSFYQKPVHAN